MSPRISVPRRLLLLCLTSFLPTLSGGAFAYPPKAEVIVVLGDLTVQKSTSEGAAAVRFCDEVKRALSELDIAFAASRDTEVEKGALAGHRVAIFPYSATWSKAETAATVRFVKEGGKVVCFYTVPPELAAAIGFRSTGLRPQAHVGELAEVRFNASAPASFTPSFGNASHATMLIEPLGEAEVVGEWFTKEGQPVGVPAVLLGPGGFYMGHVFKGSDFAGHRAYLLSVVGHYIPAVWERAVTATLTLSDKVRTYGSVDALRAAFAGRGLAEPHELREALAKRATAAEQFAAKQYRAAMLTAQEAVGLLTTAYAGLFPSRESELRACWMSYPRNTDWEQVMGDLAKNGFNAVFPLMCSAGVAYYDSAVLPLAEGAEDELAKCCRWAKTFGIEVHVWRINWQVHGASNQTFDAMKEQRRCIIEFADAKAQNSNAQRILCPTAPRNRQLEKDAMVEVIEKYPVHGIQFDYMRYGGEDQCFCDGCRERFEAWHGRELDAWPDICYGSGALAEKYIDWRVELMTASVKEISDAIHRVRPAARVSLAARTAPWPNRRRHDAQHWEDWVRKGYLDFLCPMDYTSDLKQLRQWITYQADVVNGTMPLYAGLGTTYNQRVGEAGIASDEIMLGRELGADGYIIFCWNGTMESFIPDLLRGVNHQKAVVPHNEPWIHFDFPNGVEGASPATYNPEGTLEVVMTAETRSPLGRPVKHIGGTIVTELADGSTSLPLVRFQADSVTSRSVPVPLESGSFRLKTTGTVVYADGERRQFVSRSRPFHVMEEAQAKELRERMNPPVFSGKGTRIGIFQDGYGAAGIMAALAATEGLHPAYIHQLNRETVASCDVIVLPQPRSQPGARETVAQQVLQAFVQGGGGLMVTHDSVGYRGQPALFPAVAVGGIDKVRSTECKTTEWAAKHLGIPAGSKLAHAYYDHITITPGLDGHVWVIDSGGAAVVVTGAVGKGRLAANGMATGLAQGDLDTPPEGLEKELLIKLVEWLAGSAGVKQ